MRRTQFEHVPIGPHPNRNITCGACNFRARPQPVHTSQWVHTPPAHRSPRSRRPARRRWPQRSARSRWWRSRWSSWGTLRPSGGMCVGRRVVRSWKRPTDAPSPPAPTLPAPPALFCRTDCSSRSPSPAVYSDWLPSISALCASTEARPWPASRPATHEGERQNRTHLAQCKLHAWLTPQPPTPRKHPHLQQR